MIFIGEGVFDGVFGPGFDDFGCGVDGWVVVVTRIEVDLEVFAILFNSGVFDDYFFASIESEFLGEPEVDIVAVSGGRVTFGFGIF